jgi:phosphoribosylformimino-5-aminoimidazole carboxamide ribotide isomerase
MIVIPAIDLIEGSVVRLYQGDYRQKLEYAEDPVEQALKFQAAGFKRIHVIDLEGAKTGRGQNRKAIQRVINSCRVPVQVGGGIRTEGDVEELFGWGADYLILSTTALEDPEKVARWAERWGGARFIVSMDLRSGRLQTEGWRAESVKGVSEVVQLIRDWRLEEVICTDVERDGTLEQPHYETYRELVAMLPESVSLIAAGGISSPEHVGRLEKIGVDGAVVGRALYEGTFSWEEMLSVS